MLPIYKYTKNSSPHNATNTFAYSYHNYRDYHTQNINQSLDNQVGRKVSEQSPCSTVGTYGHFIIHILCMSRQNR